MSEQAQHIKSNEFQELLEFVQKWIDFKSNGIKDISDNYLLPKQLLIGNEQDNRLNNFRLDIKKKFVKDFEGAIDTIKQAIDSNNRIFDELILLQRKYNRINNQSTLGTLEFDRAELEFTKMDNTLLYILDKLTEDDLIQIV